MKLNVHCPPDSLSASTPGWIGPAAEAGAADSRNVAAMARGSRRMELPTTLRPKTISDLSGRISLRDLHDQSRVRGPSAHPVGHEGIGHARLAEGGRGGREPAARLP